MLGFWCLVLSSTPASREQDLIDSFSIIPDPHERMSAIVAGCSGPGIPAEERREEDLVPGCVSRVWLTGTVVDGLLQLRWDAGSPLVRGLAGLVCKVYEGTAPQEAAIYRTNILTGLKLDRQLSPTRLNGLENAGRHIQALALTL